MFEKAIDLLDNPKYLGSRQVVERIVRKFVHDVFVAKDEASFMLALNRCAEIFSGVDKQWIEPPAWINRHGIGQALCDAYSLDSNQALMTIVKTAFAVMAADLVTKFHQCDGDPEKMEPVVDESIKKMVFTLLNLSDFL